MDLNTLHHSDPQALSEDPVSALSFARPMFPHTVDSTMLAAFRSCPQKMFRTYVQHWKPQSDSVHLVAGGAFAKGLEIARRAYFEGVATIASINYDVQEQRHCIWTSTECQRGDSEFSIGLGLAALVAAYGDFECPPDSAKSVERTAGAFEFYFDRYPLGADGMEPITLANGRRGIEFSFANPTGVSHPVSGDPILYTGRSDMISEFLDGVYVVDDKTTSSLGASWSGQWELRSQFTGYVWSAKKVGLDPAGAIVRGVSILKTKYDTQQAITYRTPYELDRWEEQVQRDLDRMIQCWRAGWWDYNLDNACAEYGGCNLVKICKSPNPEVWLPMHFEQRVWDPLARRQMTVAEWEKSWEPGGAHDVELHG